MLRIKLFAASDQKDFDKKIIRMRFRIRSLLFLAFLFSASATPAEAQDNRWTGIGPEGAQVRKLAVVPADPATVYAGTSNNGILKSTDGGASWNAVNNGLSSTDILSLALDPADADTLYAGTNEHGLFKSEDGGATWLAINEGLPPNYAISSIAIDPASPSTIYVGTIGDCDFFCEGQVYKSVNGGRSWNVTGINSVGISALAIDPTNPMTLYAAADFNLYKSEDGGGSWTILGETFLNPSPFPFITTIAIDPTNPSTLYIGGVGLTVRPSESRVFKGIFKSTDGGASWKETTAGLTNFNIEDIVIDAATPTTLYGVTETGVFRSGNGGDNWSELNDGLADVFVSDLAIVHSDPATVYAGTFGRGVFAIQPVGPVPAPVLRITGAFVFRKKLWVFGEKFEDDAVILLNGEEQRTRNDAHNPRATLLGKKAGRKIEHGQTVKLQVRNPDGSLSPEFTFSR